MYIVGKSKKVRNLTVSSGSWSCLGLLIMCNSTKKSLLPSSRVFGLTFNDRLKAVAVVSVSVFLATNQRKFKSFQEQVKSLKYS